MRRKMALGLAAAALAVLAVIALAGPASASNPTQVDSDFDWDLGSTHTGKHVFASKYIEPNWHSLPRASYVGDGSSLYVTYRLLGEGVRTQTEQIPYRGGSFRTSTYNDLGNGITFNKHPNAWAIVTSTSTTPASNEVVHLAGDVVLRDLQRLCVHGRGAGRDQLPSDDV